MGARQKADPSTLLRRIGQTADAWMGLAGDRLHGADLMKKTLQSDGVTVVP
jgi:hypothetical protein